MVEARCNPNLLAQTQKLMTKRVNQEGGGGIRKIKKEPCMGVHLGNTFTTAGVFMGGDVKMLEKIESIVHYCVERSAN